MKADPALALPEELTIDFKRPIEGPGGPVTSIDLREPTAGEILQWDGLSGAQADILAISIVAGVPKSVVEKMTARNFYQAGKFIGSFLA